MPILPATLFGETPEPEERRRIIRAAGDRQHSQRAARARVMRAHPNGSDSVLVGPPKAADPDASDESAESFEPAPTIDREALLGELREELNEDIERRLDAARTDGYRAGYGAAEAAFQERTEAAEEQLAAVSNRLREAWTDLLKSAEPVLADLAFRMTEGILDGPLPDDVRSLSVRTLSDALERLADHAPVELLMHPVDVMGLEETGVGGQLAATHPGLRIIGDDGMARGDWEARCSAAVVRRVAAEMLTDLRERMQLSGPTTEETP